MKYKIEVRPFNHHTFSSYCGPAFGFSVDVDGNRKYWGSYTTIHWSDDEPDPTPCFGIKEAWKAIQRIQRVSPHTETKLTPVS